MNSKMKTVFGGAVLVYFGAWLGFTVLDHNVSTAYLAASIAMFALAVFLRYRHVDCKQDYRSIDYMLLLVMLSLIIGDSFDFPAWGKAALAVIDALIIGITLFDLRKSKREAA